MPATKILQLGRDNSGYLVESYAERPFSTSSITVSLLAGVGHPLTVPKDITTVFFSYAKKTPADVFVGLNIEPVPPGAGDALALEDGDLILLEDGDSILLEGSGSAGSGIDLNPDVRTVKAGDVLHLICADATTVVINFYTRKFL